MLWAMPGVCEGRQGSLWLLGPPLTDPRDWLIPVARSHQCRRRLAVQQGPQVLQTELIHEEHGRSVADVGDTSRLAIAQRCSVQINRSSRLLTRTCWSACIGRRRTF